jgi:hypothetical protein
MQSKTRLMGFVVAIATGAFGMFASPTNWLSPTEASLISQAEARVGRPLTPGSVAGVNRRVHRRAARHSSYYGAAAGAVAIGGAGAYYGRQYYNSYDQYPAQYANSYTWRGGEDLSIESQR